MELVSIILIGIIILACLVLGMAIIRLAPEEQEPGRDYFLAVEDLCFIAASLAAFIALALSSALFSVAHGSLIANRHSFLASLKRIPAYAAFPVIAALPLLFS